jgi:hypothetical protein
VATLHLFFEEEEAALFLPLPLLVPLLVAVPLLAVALLGAALILLECSNLLFKARDFMGAFFYFDFSEDTV